MDQSGSPDPSGPRQIRLLMTRPGSASVWHTAAERGRAQQQQRQRQQQVSECLVWGVERALSNAGYENIVRCVDGVTNGPPCGRIAAGADCAEHALRTARSAGDVRLLPLRHIIPLLPEVDDVRQPR